MIRHCDYKWDINSAKCVYWAELLVFKLTFLCQLFNSQSLYIIFQCTIAVLAAPDIETCKYSMAFHRTRSLSPRLSPSVREGKSRRMEKGQISPPPPLSLTHKLSDKLVGYTKMWPVVRGRVIKASVHLWLQVWTHETIWNQNHNTLDGLLWTLYHKSDTQLMCPVSSVFAHNVQFT